METLALDEPAGCEVCGADLEWIECWQCLGDGGFDLYEEDPIFYAPGDRESCDECGGQGGWLGCTMKHDSAQSVTSTKENRK